MTLRVAIGPSSFAAADSAPLDMLREQKIEIVPNPFGRRLTEAEIIEHLKGVDGLVAGLEPLNRAVQTSAAPRLRAIARVGIGVDNVDFEAASELGIKVSNTPEPPAAAVAELTLTAMLALARGFVATNQGTHEGKWPKQIGFSLAGTPVLVVGYGHIGRRVGALLRALGAHVMVADPFVDPATLTGGEQIVTLQEGLAAARIVTLHASGKKQILGADELALMPEGSYLLNSARGELVGEEALVAALEAGRLAGVWFDAFWKEPYQGRLLEFPQALLTPHVGTYTVQCRRDMETQAVAQLLRDLGVSE